MTRRRERHNAANDYCQREAVPAENMQMAYRDFVNGVEWADETMIDKAVEWLRNHATDYVVTCYDRGELDDEGLLQDFRRAMEE